LRQHAAAAGHLGMTAGLVVLDADPAADVRNFDPGGLYHKARRDHLLRSLYK
jgi:hypothetical protein